jgi:deoxyribodipyrimidine photo-lyase
MDGRTGMAGKQAGVSLVWFRQDLRLADNPSLRAAAAGPILPLYLLDDDAPGRWAMGGAHRWWLHHSLASLAHDLNEAGAPLVLRRGDAARIIAGLVAETGAVAVHAGRMVEPWARTQEAAVLAALPGGVALHLHRAATLYEPGTIRSKTGGAYGIYTPFARAARAMGEPPPPQPAPRRLQGLSAATESLDEWRLLPAKPDWAGGLRETWRPGEAGAQARLRHFMDGRIDGYDAGRNTPGEDLTSMLSPYLHWGELSPAQVWHAAMAAGRGVGLERFLAELLWHEFSANLLWHNPHLPDAPLRPDFSRLRWRTDPAGLRAWQTGQTGVPIVDAGMRQLWHTGWMHNRVRMIAGSFLVKHLLVSWIEGERWFWDTLVDGDLAVNAQSWQWVAGSGVDSSPFFRVFNPVTQAEKFDRGGAYVRRWVPEIAALPDRWLHAPWTAPAEVLSDAGVALGSSYPGPVVALDAGRERALAAFRALRPAA